MNNTVKLALVSLIAIASVSAHAEHLTQQDCYGYPFVKNISPTHDQLEHELGMLERDGYDPDGDQNKYPGDIEHAEKKLQHDYARDCLHASTQ